MPSAPVTGDDRWANPIGSPRDRNDGMEGIVDERVDLNFDWTREPPLRGLCLVVRSLTSPAHLHQALRYHVMDGFRDLFDLPIGSVAIALPRRDEDFGYVPVLAVIPDNPERPRDGRRTAYFCWVHPLQLSPFLLEVPIPIIVGHTNGRSGHPPTHPLLPTFMKERLGQFNAYGSYYLPAAIPPPELHHEIRLIKVVPAWTWDHPDSHSKNSCTGHCLSTILRLVRDPGALADLLWGLADCEPTYIICRHAKHRSVAAAVFAMLYTYSEADLANAANCRTDRCCHQRALDNMGTIETALRRLPRPPERLLLVETTSVRRRVTRSSQTAGLQDYNVVPPWRERRTST